MSLKRLHLRLDDGLLAQLDAEAAEVGWSRNKLIDRKLRSAPRFVTLPAPYGESATVAVPVVEQGESQPDKHRHRRKKIRETLQATTYGCAEPGCTWQTTEHQT